MQMNDQIAAVLVTYNRKALLKDCFDAVVGQTLLPDAIIIIDNNSMDGTQNLLIQENLISSKFACSEEFDFSKKKLPMKNGVVIDILYFKYHQNSGGAGGFHKGIKIAHEKGYGWIWVMDDDVEPLPSALELLFKHRNLSQKIGFLASRVRGAESDTSMNLPEVDTSLNENGYPDWEKYLEQGIVKIKRATFVSILLNSRIIDTVGLPYASFFIWGDDTEYTLRITQQFRFNAYLVGASVVIHRRENQKSISIQNESDPVKAKQYYYFFRNHYIIAKKYYLKRDAMFNLIDSAYLILQLLFSKDKLKQTKINCIAKGMLDGLFFKE